MASRTNIEWTDWNWNFLRGCSRVSEGCRNCYAEKVAARFSDPGRPYHNIAVRRPFKGDQRSNWTGEIGFYEEILLRPLRWTKPRKIFVNSMSDLFHEKVTDQMLDKAFAVMALTPQHTYQILTKRPERMLSYFGGGSDYWPFIRLTDINETTPIPARDLWLANSIYSWAAKYGGEGPLPNVWLGVSVEDQKTADERIPLLLQTPAAIRWISAEPLLGPINLEQIANDHWAYGHRDVLAGYLCGDHPDEYYADDAGLTRNPPDKWERGPHGHLDWVVVGGESGPGARPCDIANIRSIVAQCKAADVPVFVKQLGAKPEDPTHRDIWVNGEHHYTRSVGDPMLEQAAATKGYSITNQQLDRHMKSRKGGDMSEWPEDLRVREMPELSK